MRKGIFNKIPVRDTVTPVVKAACNVKILHFQRIQPQVLGILISFIIAKVRWRGHPEGI